MVFLLHHCLQLLLPHKLGTSDSHSFGSNGDSVAEAVAKTEGVSKVLVAKDSEYDHYLAEKVSPLLKRSLKTKSLPTF